MDLANVAESDCVRGDSSCGDVLGGFDELAFPRGRGAGVAMLFVSACMSSPFARGGFMTRGVSAVQRPGELGAQRRDLSDCRAHGGAPVVDDVALQIGHVRTVGVQGR